MTEGEAVPRETRAIRFLEDGDMVSMDGTSPDEEPEQCREVGLDRLLRLVFAGRWQAVERRVVSRTPDGSSIEPPRDMVLFWRLDGTGFGAMSWELDGASEFRAVEFGRRKRA